MIESGQSTREVSAGFLSIARQILPERPVICEVGSRDALDAVFLFRHLTASAIHKFEPNPAAARICRQNLASLLAVEEDASRFNEIAVSDREGEIKFFPVDALLSHNKDIGFSSMFPINPEYTKRRGCIVQDEIVVRSITLDRYFAGPPPDLLWVDVEGAELKVLRGAAQILPHIRLIHIEVSFRPMQIGKPLLWEIERYLVARGFRFRCFVEVSALIGYLYRHRLLPNLPWRLNAVFENVRFTG